jgi:hypothetical protein
VVGLLVTALGLAGTAVVAWRPATPLVVVTAVVLGTGYGILLVTGLDKVERMAGQHEFAGLVSIFYALAYLAFAAPYLLAALTGGVSYALWLVIAALATLATIPLMMLGGRPAERIVVVAPPHGSEEGNQHAPAIL